MNLKLRDNSIEAEKKHYNLRFGTIDIACNYYELSNDDFADIILSQKYDYLLECPVGEIESESWFDFILGNINVVRFTNGDCFLQFIYCFDDDTDHELMTKIKSVKENEECDFIVNFFLDRVF